MSSNDLRDYIDQQMAGAAEPDADPEDESELDLEDTDADPETGDDDDEDDATAAEDADGDEDDDEVDEVDDEDEDDDWTPTTGAEVVAWALESEADLRANGWESVEEFLLLAASDARWWIETAALMGWPAEARPQQRDLPAELGMGVIAAGIPGARLIQDPLHRMRPGSKRRLW